MIFDSQYFMNLTVDHKNGTIDFKKQNCRIAITPDEPRSESGPVIAISPQLLTGQMERSHAPCRLGPDVTSRRDLTRSTTASPQPSRDICVGVIFPLVARLLPQPPPLASVRGLASAESSMSRRWLLALAAAAALGCLVAIPAPVPAQEKKADDKDMKKRTEDAVEKGLEWLKKTQAQDGHWEAQGGQYPTTMTALAGMCFLMEGSTLKEGKYSDQVQKAVNWFLHRTGSSRTACSATRQPDRVIAVHVRPRLRHACSSPASTARRRTRTSARSSRSASRRPSSSSAKAQTNKKHRKPEGKEVDVGGWGYVSAADGGNFDEGSVTITQLQALRAARNAGIPVPKEIDRQGDRVPAKPARRPRAA